MSKDKVNTYLNLKTGMLTCTMCGKTFDMQLPQDVDFLGRVSKAFDIEHRGCQKK